MRLAIVVDTFPVISETFISNKAASFASKGNEVIVFCNRRNVELLNDLFGDNKRVKVVLFRKRKVLLYSLLHPSVLIRALKGLHDIPQNVYRSFRISIINSYRPDILHFEFSGIGVDYLYEMKFFHAKKVISCRGSAEKVKLMIYEDRKRKFKELLDIVDSIHCVSSDIQKTILPYCSDERKLFINYPSIDTEFFRCGNTTRKRNVLTILSVGRLTFQKGYPTGLHAMHFLKERGIFFRWIIVGSGTDYEEIMFQINELGLKNVVELAGAKSRSEIKQLMEEVHIYLLPSVYEGIANVVLEAMSMELPVVSTRCGGMEEVITHGENGFLSDVYDHICMAENLLELLENEHLREVFGKAGRKKVVENFDLKLQIDKFDDVYHLLLNNRTVKTEIEVCDDKFEQNKKPLYYHKANAKQKKLRIGVIVPHFPSYTETFFINKIIGFCDRGHEIIVFCNKTDCDRLLEETYHFSKYSNLKIVTIDFNESSFKFFRTIFANPLIILKNITINLKNFRSNAYYSLCEHYFKKYACDIYHFGYSGLAVSYLAVLKSLPGKIVVSCRGTAENVKPLTEQGRIQKLYEMFSLVHRIHCVSNKMGETIKQYGAMDKKIFVNYSAVNTDFFTRKKEYVSHKHINILSIGRLVFQKGFLIGILAISELKKKFGDFTWTIIGEGPEKEQIIFYINSLGLINHVKLAGKKIRSEIIELYEEHDILFSPSICEGIANVVLEGMAMELPVVSSINGGIEEVVIHNQNGLLCNNYDYASMAELLFELCIDFEKRKRLGKCGRKVIESNFCVKKNIDAFENQYYELIQ